jgi:hypothetical protein
MNPIPQNEPQKQQSVPDENSGIAVQGHIKIFDPDSGEVFVNKRNAIHYENMSEAIAYSLANRGINFITEMHLGNGGTTIDPTGVINYLPPNVKTQGSDLYNPTYYKIVDNTSPLNLAPLTNKMSITHVPGNVYSDIIVTCLLDYGEPGNQLPFDNAQNTDSSYVFDELGLKGFNTAGAGLGKLLTHVIFHPVQKSLNRQIQIDYTVRIQTITNLTS